MNIASGIDLINAHFSAYKNLRLALVTNNVATTEAGTSSRVHLLAEGFTLSKLFSPEHGLTATGDDGAYQSNHTDLLTGLPVISLYGDHLAPTAEELGDIEAVFFDIPDVGCRFYTYLWTMTHVMEACAASGKPFILLDRPNPISGNLSLTEGPMLDEKKCSSFIGRWSIPLRHSCTLGELAGYFAATRIPNLDLRVIPVKYWNRNQYPTDTGWLFTPTSPAIRHPETATLYPGTGLLEGIMINEGRGSDFPFLQCGAPWIDPLSLASSFNSLGHAGILAVDTSYTPVESIYAHTTCHGLRFTITDKQVCRPVESMLSLLRLLVQRYPTEVKERLYKTRANPSGEAHLDKLLGIAGAFRRLQQNESIETTIAATWQQHIQPFLLYE